MCGCGNLSVARGRLLANDLADASATPKLHNLSPHLNPDCFYLSGNGLSRLSWKTGR